METIDYDAMDDDAFLAASEDLPISETVEEVVIDAEADIADEADTEVDTDTPDDGDAEAELDGDEDTQHTEEDTEETDPEAEDSTDDNDDEESENTDADTDGDDGDQETDTDTDDDTFDFEAGYKDLLAPFKANGSEMQVDNVEDARRLMQMGAGATKQMLKLKPHLKIVQSLKENGLLDQGKLDHLIELSTGSPEAIAKLLKDRDINPLDVNLDSAEDYEPKSHEISDSAFDLNQAIDSIRETDGFEKSMNILGEQWDQSSRETIAENPSIVNIVNDHVQSGVFEKVQAEVDKERALGRMTGMSDVEAYYEAAGALQKKGILVDETGSSSKSEEDPLKQEADKVVKSKAKAKAKARKKAAAPSGNRGKGAKVEKDLSGLSDEEFLKEFEKL